MYPTEDLLKSLKEIKERIGHSGTQEVNYSDIEDILDSLIKYFDYKTRPFMEGVSEAGSHPLG